MTIRVERLGRGHRSLLDDFDAGEPELTVYLRRWALVHQERDHLGRTFVAIDEGPDLRRVAGFFTLAAASLDRERLSEGRLDRLPRFPIPAVLLARLAVDRRVQGQGLGTWLLDDALQRTLRLASDGPIGFRVLLTDAKTERAARFYTRKGLLPLEGATWPRRMVLDLRPILSPA